MSEINLNNDKFKVISLTNVTERTKLPRELHENRQEMDKVIASLTTSNEQLERFAFVCSHDLQEPIRMVVS